MSGTFVILLFLLWFAAFLIMGQNVSSCLFGAGIVGLLLMVGPGKIMTVLSGIMGADVFYTASTYSLSIIPLYVLMAQFLVRGNIIEDLFAVTFKVSGGRRFVLGTGTIVLGGLLGAVSGSGSAIAAALATSAAPELYNYGYSEDFSLATAAVAGSLSAIVPPSLIVIIYGSLTEIPIGHLFMGSFIPGALFVIIYIVCLYFLGKGKKTARQDRPPTQISKQSYKLDVKRSVPAFVFVVVLMIVIFGGIYGGVVTAGEAGALGAFVSLVGVLVLRRLTLENLKEALMASVKMTAMIMIIVIGAQIFGRFMSYAMIPRQLLALVEPIIPYPTILIGILLFIFFIFGMFLESAAIMVMTIPVILPILKVAQINMLWFGVMACITISLGLLTPPVGLSVYCAASAARYPVERVFKYSIVFATVAALILIPLMMKFPVLVMYLPNRMGY